MNPTLLKLAQFVARRPSDMTIKILHIITGIFILWSLWFAGDHAVMDIPFVGVYE